MKTEKVLLAGATGYLGRYIANQLIESEYNTRLIVRDRQKAKFDPQIFEIVEAEVTKPGSLTGICKDIDVVISTIGITRQKDGLTYMDVDYQANVNLIDAAKNNGVRKFIYVSVLNGDKLKNLKICEAKEKFVDYLKSSGIEYCIIRPNGFFSDMGEFLKMAKSGKVYLFGSGEFKFNPIHGADLARICVDMIKSEKTEVNIGGPDILTQNRIAKLAFNALSKKQKIIHLPDWIRKLTLFVTRTFCSSKTYGPIEFFLTTMAMDMIAPQYGKNTLESFYRSEAEH